MPEKATTSIWKLITNQKKLFNIVINENILISWKSLRKADISKYDLFFGRRSLKAKLIVNRNE
jgi:hypothetical protein